MPVEFFRAIEQRSRRLSRQKRLRKLSSQKRSTKWRMRAQSVASILASVGASLATSCCPNAHVARIVRLSPVFANARSATPILCQALVNAVLCATRFRASALAYAARSTRAYAVNAAHCICVSAAHAAHRIRAYAARCARERSAHVVKDVCLFLASVVDAARHIHAYACQKSMCRKFLRSSRGVMSAVTICAR